MASIFISGLDGRVREGTSGQGTAVAGLTKWQFTRKASPTECTHFESAADANGNVHRELVVGGNTANSAASGAKVGIISNTIALEGRLDGNTLTGTYARLGIGFAVQLDLIKNKTSALGLYNLQAVITEFSSGADIKSTDASAFTATAEVTGVPGALTETAA